MNGFTSGIHKEAEYDTPICKKCGNLKTPVHIVTGEHDPFWCVPNQRGTNK